MFPGLLATHPVALVATLAVRALASLLALGFNPLQ